MSSLRYKPYYGPRDLVFIRAHKDDRKDLERLCQKLIEKKIRVFFDCSNSDDSAAQEDVAAGILNSTLCIFILSKKAASSLDMRNSINYAMSLKKETVIIRKDKDDLGYGLDMQLSNVQTLNENEVIDLISGNHKSCIGEGQPVSTDDRKQKTRALIAIAFTLAFMIVAGIILKNRIDYYNSAKYRLKDIDQSDYLDFTSFKEGDIVYLKDKKIKEISFADMGLRSIEGIEDVDTEHIDISGNPDLKNINPILRSQSIKTVALSQDMIIVAEMLRRGDIEVIITR
ncbi:MAG: toll/interleukin-1 receptor domain-containing protein [Erysipelotrichaceae bacterium]|nr:toll/interleukin-1 receptor domain-containing protein [Erysipelotrichaceae bacterium]